MLVTSYVGHLSFTGFGKLELESLFSGFGTVLSAPGSGSGWPIVIVNPHATGEVVKVVTLHDQSMAPSGRYERGAHVIDPATGAPALKVDSATVVGPDADLGDAVASAVLVRGRDSMTGFRDLGPALVTASRGGTAGMDVRSCVRGVSEHGSTRRPSGTWLRKLDSRGGR